MFGFLFGGVVFGWFDYNGVFIFIVLLLLFNFIGVLIFILSMWYLFVKYLVD